MKRDIKEPTSNVVELAEPSVIAYLILKGFKPKLIIQDDIVVFRFINVEEPLDDFYSDAPASQVSALAYSQTLKSLRNRIYATRGKRHYGEPAS